MDADAQARVLADAFVAAASAGQLPGVRALAPTDLDFSVRSLKLVDACLAIFHELGQAASSSGTVSGADGLHLKGATKPAFDMRKSQSDREVVLAVGAYFGEVLKSSSRRGYQWIWYEDARSVYHVPEDAIGPAGIYNVLVLHAKDDDFLFPIVRCFRAVDSGAGESTYAFAVVQLKQEAQ